MNEETQQPKPRLLGEYLPCSRGAIRMAMQKKRDAKIKGEANTYIGELLLNSEAITEEDLETALRHQRADRLGLCPVFESLTRTELAAIGNHFKEISIQAKQQFIMEGENDPSLYILVSGDVEVFRTDDEGNEIHIANVGPVEPIGEMGYFQGGIRTASVRAATPVELLTASYSSLTHYFEHVPRVAHAFMEVVQRRREETEKRMQDAQTSRS